MWKGDYSDKQKEEIKKQTKSEFRQTNVMFEAKLVAGEAPTEGELVEETP